MVSSCPFFLYASSFVKIFSTVVSPHLYVSGSPEVNLESSPFCPASSITSPAWTGQCPHNILCVPRNISRIQMTVFDSGHPSGFKGRTALSLMQMSTLRVTCPLVLLSTLTPSQVVFLTGALQVQTFGALVWTIGIASQPSPAFLLVLICAFTLRKS